MDLNVPLHAPVWLATGAEFTLAATENLGLALRAGANTRTPELGGLAGLHAGLGIELGRKVDVNYSFDPFGDLGSMHRFSMGYRW